MTTMRITTPRMEDFTVNLETGAINVSGGWLFLGFQHVKRTHEIIKRDEITPERLRNMTWCYKNGNPQWTVIDRDHGTKRIWGNTKAHGVWFAKVLQETTNDQKPE